MKKLSRILAVAGVLLCGGAGLEAQHELNVGGPTYALGTVTAAGVMPSSLVFANGTPAPSNYSLHWTVDGPAPTSCALQGESSPDNQHWTAVTASQSCTATGSVSVSGTPAPFVHVNVTAYSASGGTTVKAFYTRGDSLSSGGGGGGGAVSSVNNQTGAVTITPASIGADASGAAATAQAASLQKANNLADVASLTAARVNLGIGTAPPNTVCSLGDSLVSLNDGTGAQVDTQWGPNLFSAMLLLNGGQWQFVHNGGIPGQLTNQILGRISADTLTQSCHVVFVLAGTNDVNSGVAAATTHTNLLSMWSQIVANGQIPVPLTIPPYNGNYYTQVAALNTWIRGEAAKLKLPLLDFYSLVVDPTTGNYLAGYSDDGVHPNHAALRLIAQNFNPQFANLLGPYKATLPYYNSDPGNLLPNALNLTVSGNFPSGCSQVGTNANFTYSVTTDPNIGGKAITIVKAATAAGDSGGESCYYVTSGFTAGDRMTFVGKLDTSGAESGSLVYGVQLFIYSAGFASNLLTVSPVFFFSGTELNGQWYLPFTMPAGAAIIQAQITVQTGTGTLKVGQMGLYDITNMAL